MTLYNLDDFITFLRIMASRCTMADIPDTQGASLLDGISDWTKIRAHKAEYIAGELKKGNPNPDWISEFKRFTSDKRNYLSTLAVLSVGPYSGISTEAINGYFHSRGQRMITEEEWLSLSDTIRRYHECTHFICRKRYPDKKDAVWDELVADAVGISAAFGSYERGLGELFLGIKDGRYTGGRLENYIEADTSDKKEQVLEDLALKIVPVLINFEELINENEGMNPFDIAVLLEESKL